MFVKQVKQPENVQGVCYWQTLARRGGVTKVSLIGNFKWVMNEVCQEKSPIRDDDIHLCRRLSFTFTAQTIHILIVF